MQRLRRCVALFLLPSEAAALVPGGLGWLIGARSASLRQVIARALVLTLLLEGGFSGSAVWAFLFPWAGFLEHRSALGNRGTHLVPGA